MREIPIQSSEPLWRQAISGAQILFVAFGALVLVPLLTGLNPSLALLGAGVGTLLFQLITGRQVPIFLGSSFAFIAPIIFSIQTWGVPATMGALACVSLMYFVFAGLVWKHGADIVHRYMPPVVVGPIIMIIGLSLAGLPNLPLPAPIRRLILNDVGPSIEWAALERIGQYLGKSATFASVEEAAAAMRVISASFGPHTDQQWLDLSRPMLKALPEGGFRLHYDPAIAVPFRHVTREASIQGETALWQIYDQISAQTLVLRGAESDLLSKATAQAMTQRGPRPRLVEFAGVGHAPTLVAPDQVAAVVDFLLAAEGAVAG